MDYSGATPQVQRLIDEFGRLPGIGPKSAQRLAYYLIKMPEEISLNLAESILSVKKSIVLCSTCFHITDTDPCNLCTNTYRDQKTICVVEQPLDLIALEKSGSYNGQYHVLHGAISPINGIGPDDLKIKELFLRLKNEMVDEVILATNLHVEGEATAMYINNLLASTGIKITIPARGLSVGGDLQYADEATLGRAIEGRQGI
ncbi:MAG: recombination protein RecR [Chloroflexi bacterium]|nr:recombination protein RecR [Chloroflexota bacterium]MBA14681.1 recombination protein RecR [Chloroflexota bacterium]MBG55252.1 recombination protein RecR [Chloroflexota bacterium]|tara:strand:- start:2475 stop:3080 length:606 start_codon:yes stop_codon:yes gene_type:complete